MSTTLATRLRAAREAINPSITQAGVAKLIGRSPSALNLWEVGKNEPSASHLAELAKLYKVSADWLLGVDSKNAPAIVVSSELKINVVPVVKTKDLAHWRWEKTEGTLQTTGQYPSGTAAAINITSDALASVCPKGSLVVVSKAHEITDGSIVAAVTPQSDEPVVRRFVSEGGAGLLVADDNRYPSYALAQGVRIVGKVVEVTIRKTLP